MIRLLYLFVPAAFAAGWWLQDDTLVFVFSAIGIVPLAKALGHATEVLASRAGPGVAGMLNAGLGNLAEVIIAVAALVNGHPEVVKASLTGSIIANTLLVFGLSAFVGGLGRQEQVFNQVATGSGAALLMVMATALVLPSLFLPHVRNAEDIRVPMSAALAGVLLLCFLAGLVFALRTHRQYFQEQEDAVREAKQESVPRALAKLIASAALIAVLAELLASTVDHATERLGFSKAFVGVIIVALVGNAAEHGIAVVMAAKNRMNLAVHISLESSKQIAIFVAPILVFAGIALGRPMDLVFPPWEVGAVWASCLIFSLVCVDGRSNWLEGVCLMAVYAVVAVTFYFIP